MPYLKCLNGQCPEYLFNKLVRVSDTSVRSSRYGHITLRCPKYNRVTKGGKTFLTTSTLLWNSLPVNIRSSESINAFKHKYIKYIKEEYANIDHFPISQYFNFYFFITRIQLGSSLIIVIIHSQEFLNYCNYCYYLFLFIVRMIIVIQVRATDLSVHDCKVFFPR